MMVKNIERMWYDKEQQKSQAPEAVRTGNAVGFHRYKPESLLAESRLPSLQPRVIT